MAHRGTAIAPGPLGETASTKERTTNGHACPNCGNEHLEWDELKANTVAGRTVRVPGFHCDACEHFYPESFE